MRFIKGKKYRARTSFGDHRSIGDIFEADEDSHFMWYTPSAGHQSKSSHPKNWELVEEETKTKPYKELFPQEIYEKVLSICGKTLSPEVLATNPGSHFVFFDQLEGQDFWYDVLYERDYDKFFTRYPKDSGYKGEIKGFPKEIVEKMLDRQVEEGNKRDVSVFEIDRYSGKSFGFHWSSTCEGSGFWDGVIGNRNFDVFFSKYPRLSNSDILEEEIPIEEPLPDKEDEKPMMEFSPVAYEMHSEDLEEQYLKALSESIFTTTVANPIRNKPKGLELIKVKKRG